MQAVRLTRRLLGRFGRRFRLQLLQPQLQQLLLLGAALNEAVCLCDWLKPVHSVASE